MNSNKTDKVLLDDLLFILNKDTNASKRDVGVRQVQHKLSENSKLPNANEQQSYVPKRGRPSSKMPAKQSAVVVIEDEPENIKSEISIDLENKAQKNMNIPENIGNDLFKGKKFTFIPYNKRLPPRRINILSENIKKQGGIVIQPGSFIWNPARNGDALIIVAKEMPYEILMNTVPAIFEQEIRNFTFLDCEWLSKCLQRNKWVDQSPYYVKWENNFALQNEARSTQDESTKATLNEYIETKTNGNDAVKKDFETKSDTFIKKDLYQDTNVTEVRQKDQWQNQSPIELEDDEKDPMKTYGYLIDYLYEPIRMRLSTQGSEGLADSSALSQEHILIEDEDEDDKTLKIENNQFAKVEPKIEFNEKIEYDFNKRPKLKREAGLKSEGGTRDFTYIIDDDDDLIYEGHTRKKLKLEADDVKGTLLEGIENLDQINAGNDGEILELKDFKAYNPARRYREKVVERNDNKPLKEEILLCQPESKKNLNAHITDELEKMLRIYKLQKDEGRMHGYGKAIATLKAFPKKVESVKDIKSILGIGSSMVLKIKEILETGKLRRAETMQSDKKTQVLTLFDEIYGIGSATALQLYNKGFRTIEDLRNNQHVLNDIQKVGLKYYEELKQKIPRDIVTEIFEIAKAKIDELSEYKGQFEVICGGSYRRGRAMCGDVDIILSPKDGKPPAGFLMMLIKGLEGTLLTNHLLMPPPGQHEFETYLGICYYKGMHRRIDFKICSRERFGPLTIYYTGGDYFNRSMRIVAEKKGLHLDDFGLFPVIRVNDTKHDLRVIPCYTEHDVFKALGLKYVPPEQRDI